MFGATCQHISRRIALQGLAFGLALLLAGSAGAEERFVPYAGPPQPVTMASLIPRVVSDENYYEQYNFEASFGEGRSFYLRLRIANLGPGDGRLEVTARMTNPADKSRLKASTRFDRGEWSHGKSAFAITAGKTKVSGTPQQLAVQGAGPGFGYDLQFTRESAGWQPGNGRVQLGRDGYHATQIIFPRAQVKGTIRVGDKSFELAGVGFATHSHSNVAPYTLARRWVQFDSHDSDYAVFLRQFIPAKGFPQRPVGFLLVTYRDQVVFQSYNVRVTPERATVDAKTEARYAMPARLVIDAEAPGQTLHGVLDGTRLYLRSAMLEEAGTMERLVIKQVAEPVDYNYHCNYQLTLTNQGSAPVTFGGKADYAVNYLNP